MPEQLIFLKIIFPSPTIELSVLFSPLQWLFGSCRWSRESSWDLLEERSVTAGWAGMCVVPSQHLSHLHVVHPSTV